MTGIDFRNVKGIGDHLRSRRFRARVGNGAGTTWASDHEIWVRTAGDASAVKVLCDSQPYEDMWVWCGPRVPGGPIWMLEPILDEGQNLDGYSFVAPHGRGHEVGEGPGQGVDPVYVYLRGLVPGLVHPQLTEDLTVIVEEISYPWESASVTLEAQTLDLSGNLPGDSGEHRWVLISINPATNALQTTNGTDVDEAIEPDYPSSPANSIPLARVLLAEDTTEITEGCIEDARQLLVPITAGLGVINLGDLNDVTIASVGEGDGLIYDSGDSRWENIKIKADGVAKSVKTSGGDFTAVQDGINWYKGRLLTGSNIVSADAGTWAEKLTVEDIFIAKGGALVIRGDTRALAALSYAGSGLPRQNNTGYVIGDTIFVSDPAGDQSIPPRTFECTTAGTTGAAPPAWDGTIGNTTVDGTATWTCRSAMKANRGGLTNGGETGGWSGLYWDAGNARIHAYVYDDNCALSSPDFDADSWAAGDAVLIYDGTNPATEYAVTAVSNESITINVAGGAPAATFGADGTAFVLLPNRRIVPASAGTVVQVNFVRGVRLDGWYIKTHTGAACYGLVNDGGGIYLDNVVIQAEDYDVIVRDSYAWLEANTGANSFWGAAYHLAVNNAVQILAQYATLVGGTVGCDCTNFSYANMDSSICVSCATLAHRANMYSFVYAYAAMSRQITGTAYTAAAQSLLYAYATNNYNNGNGVNYNPAPVVPGWAQSASYGALYAS